MTSPKTLALTNPPRQYVATALFAIIALVSALRVVTLQQNAEHLLTAQTASVSDQHTTSLADLAYEEYIHRTSQ